MKLKKNRDYDLERLRTPLTFLGLLFASAFTLAMLEWQVKIVRENQYEHPVTLTDEAIFIAIPEKTRPMPKPKPKPVIDAITLIENSDVEPVLPDLVLPKPDYLDVIPIEKKVETVDEQVVIAPDIYPEFPGGLAAMHAYLRSELNYPAMARQQNIQGKVWVEFVVNKNGDITDVKIVRGIGGGCDREALRVVLEMPRWTPGKQRGHPVSVLYHLPIGFVLKE